MQCRLCEFPVFGRDLCAAHYYRDLRHGDPLHGGEVVRERPRGLGSEAEVFAWFMPGDPPHAPSGLQGCWDWKAGTRNGFGVFSYQGRTVNAHHISYGIHRGPLPAGPQMITQTCGRRICVQPAHLKPGRHTPARTPSAAAILTEDDVRWIRRQTGLSHRAMATQLGVSRDTVTAIRNGKRWKHVI